MSTAKKTTKRRVVPAEPRKHPTESLPAWGERMRQIGRSPILIPLAQLMAVAQPDVTEMVEAVLSGKLQRKYPDMSREQRRAYYRNPRFFWKDLIETIHPVLPPKLLDGIQLVRLLKIANRSRNRFSQEERREFSEAIIEDLRRPEATEELASFRENFWKEISSVHLDNVQSESGEEFTLEMLQAPCVQFLFTVFFPSMVCYGKTPWELFREAAGGNTSSLCNLLRIDKQVIFLQEIVEEQQKFFYKKNTTAVSAIGAALKGKPLGKRSPRLLKYGIIKFLQSLSASIPEFFRSSELEFTSTDFADLFEIVTRENKEPQKNCLPEDIDTFRKGLQRAKVNIGVEGWDIFL